MIQNEILSKKGECEKYGAILSIGKGSTMILKIQNMV
jgi:hypothetical protein